MIGATIAHVLSYKPPVFPLMQVVNRLDRREFRFHPDLPCNLHGDKEICGCGRLFCLEFCLEGIGMAYDVLNSVVTCMVLRLVARLWVGPRCRKPNP
jgi:hypothetical protein